MKKFLSVVLAFLMLAVMLPVTAMAEEGDPTCVNGVWQNVTPANVQDVLDGKYGSIDNTTIILSAGTYGQLELGRATKYEGSNTTWYNGQWSQETGWTRVESAVSAVSDLDPNLVHFYHRTISGVTLKAASNAAVSVAGVKMTSGHIHGTTGTPAHDYVLDKEIPSTPGSYHLAQTVSNITFDGITFTAISDINTSNAETTIKGVTFKNCTFDINNTASGNQAIRYYNENNNGNMTDLTVDNCKFNSCYQGVYTGNIKNVTVKNSTFDTTGHNAIAIQDKSTCDHGNVVITGNTFKNVGDCIIRFNNVGEGTTITISKNTSTNSGKADGEIIKATTRPDTVTVSMTGNNWGTSKEGMEAKFGDGFTDVVNEPINENPTVIIIDRTEDTPKTDDQKNPATGANDVVAAAVALMAVSALGLAVLTRKK